MALMNASNMYTGKRIEKHLDSHSQSGSDGCERACNNASVCDQEMRKGAEKRRKNQKRYNCNTLYIENGAEFALPLKWVQKIFFMRKKEQLICM